MSRKNLRTGTEGRMASCVWRDENTRAPKVEGKEHVGIVRNKLKQQL